MEESALIPIPGMPLLKLESRGAPPVLLLADLHLGLGGSDRLNEGPPEASAPGLAATLLEQARASRARSIVIAGDVKHPIVGTPAALRPVLFDFFSTLLTAGIRVDVVLGNHDVGLVRYLPREVEVHPASGAIVQGVGIFHGHCWPSNAVLRTKTLVAGHLHPGVRLAATGDERSGKRPCWVRVAFPAPSTRPKRRRRHGPIRARELVILPPFNPLAGTETLNRSAPRSGRTFLFSRFLAAGTARAYLLDGTDLGTIATRSVDPPARARSEARPVR
ncbi:MAG: metallophosphoesterase [Thermoplasmata archaeon]|nr:metallophosphoesterase [Thermoplasmata archaeon]